jgi:hypothetical protein
MFTSNTTAPKAARKERDKVYASLEPTTHPYKSSPSIDDGTRLPELFEGHLSLSPGARRECRKPSGRDSCFTKPIYISSSRSNTVHCGPPDGHSSSPHSQATPKIGLISMPTADPVLESNQCRTESKYTLNRASDICSLGCTFSEIQQSQSFDNVFLWVAWSVRTLTTRNIVRKGGPELFILFCQHPDMQLIMDNADHEPLPRQYGGGHVRTRQNVVAHGRIAKRHSSVYRRTHSITTRFKFRVVRILQVPNLDRGHDDGGDDAMESTRTHS